MIRYFHIGGHRAWPLPGFWREPNIEASTDMVPCSFPESTRCQGGKYSTCGDGYEGVACGECKENYYLDGLACLTCQREGDREEAMMHLLVVVVLFLAVGYVFIFGKRKHVNTVIAALVTFQQILLSLESLQNDVRSSNVVWLKSTYKILQLFSLNHSFIRPGCVIGKIRFVNLFYVQLGFSLGVGVYFVLCALVYQYRKRAFDSEAWIRNPSNPRVKLAVVSAVFATYTILNKSSLTLLRCEKVNGFDEYRLVSEKG